jgi:hypothetical protein
MTDAPDMGTRRFGRWNRVGLATLIEREVRRFTAVWTQTLLAPLVTAGLFLAVFALAIGPVRGEVMGVPFIEFLAPGLLMMTVIQNAFANTSSSLMISKVQGNIVDTLMPPLSPAELVRLHRGRHRAGRAGGRHDLGRADDRARPRDGASALGAGLRGGRLGLPGRARDRRGDPVGTSSTTWRRSPTSSWCRCRSCRAPSTRSRGCRAGCRRSRT